MHGHVCSFTVWTRERALVTLAVVWRLGDLLLGERLQALGIA